MTRLTSFLGNLFGSSHNAPKVARKTTLGVQPLEAREVPAIFLAGNGVLTVEGTNSNEIVLVSRLGADTATTADDEIRVTRHTALFAPPAESLSVNVGLVQSIKVNLNGGNDLFQNDTGVMSVVFGGSGNDTLRGGYGTDHLNGEGNNDLIWGNGGNDLLSGGSGSDRLYGGTGFDNLTDTSGVNGLYGGAGQDVLIGGTGSDRFLDAGGDVVGDQGGSNVFIGFQDTTSNVTDDGMTFDDQNWSQTDIERVDGALAILHEKKGNPTFLKYDGDGIVFRRLGEHLSGDGSNVYGWNADGGVITLTQKAFGSTDNVLRHTVLHEIGHNWDEVGENASYGQHQAIGGWTHPVMAMVPGSGFSFSGDGNWAVKTDAEFASKYAKNNPKDDFAESFALYFLNEVGQGLAVGSGLKTFAQLPLKMAYMDGFVNSAS